jgi:type I restriction enzyme, S subunit
MHMDFLWSTRLEHVGKIKIPLPHLAEQRRIAAVLERAEALRAKRRAALVQLDTLTQSIFLDLFGDPTTNPNGFSRGNIEVAVKDARKDIRCGPFGTQLKVHELVDSGIPLLGIENVLDEGFRPETRKFLTDMKANELRAFDVAPGDVLVTRMGTIGRACVVPETFTGGRFSYHLFRIRPDIARCVPEFLAATISKSGTFQTQLRNYAHGAIMDGLNTTDLKAVQFLVPPIRLQREFVAAVAAIEKLRASQRASLAELDALFATLQYRAFRGEL